MYDKILIAHSYFLIGCDFFFYEKKKKVKP